MNRISDTHHELRDSAESRRATAELGVGCLIYGVTVLFAIGCFVVAILALIS